MKALLGPLALLFCFMVVLIGPFLLPRLPPDEAETPPPKPGVRDKAGRRKA
jgi:hypothetical protein